MRAVFSYRVCTLLTSQALNYFILWSYIVVIDAKRLLCKMLTHPSDGSNNANLIGSNRHPCELVSHVNFKLSVFQSDVNKLRYLDLSQISQLIIAAI